jgi:ubiquinone/menaquinone biosynthesis C-methylase UbiE
METTHEQKVEKFYSHGSKKRGNQEGGFLSLGYWNNNHLNYHQAVEVLINHLLKDEKPMKSGNVLNVACGYGAETMEIYKKLVPDKIIAIDITEPHVEFAKTRVEHTALSDKIIFEKMDACKLPYKPSSFKYVIGIEGPAHFNTRQKFLQKAYEVMDDKGVLLLADITVNELKGNRNILNNVIGNSCAKHWYMPKENWMSTNQMLEMIKKIGFTIDSCEVAGDKVYPGFAKFNLKWSSIINAFRIRGIWTGSGLTIISWMLGYLYNRKMIDYVFIRAIKPV